MKAIHRFIPAPRHTEIMRIFVNASAEQTWQLARHYDMSSVSWVRFLFRMRTITEIFHGEKKSFGSAHKGFIDEIEENGKGFIVLEEHPGHEIVVGAIGRFWHIDIPFADVTSANFHSFNDTGWGKVAWSIKVEPYLHGSTLAFELRTDATDDESWVKLNRYYHVIGSFSKLIRHSLLSHLEADLGKMERPDDHKKVLPGDELIPGTRYTITDAADIEAPAPVVWRYLMQLGCDRAGWYSIDWLDNGGRASTDKIVLDWSDRVAGERISATPKNDSFFEVYKVIAPQVLLIGGEQKNNGEFFKVTWSFVLDPLGEDATHIVVRARMEMTPGIKEWWMGNIIYPPMHALMEAVQLRTITKYAERDALQTITLKNLGLLQPDERTELSVR